MLPKRNIGRMAWRENYGTGPNDEWTSVRTALGRIGDTQLPHDTPGVHIARVASGTGTTIFRRLKKVDFRRRGAAPVNSLDSVLHLDLASRYNC